MMRRLLWVAGAGMWGGLTFLMGLYVTFPAEAAKKRLIYEVGENTHNEYALDVGDLSLWRLSGLALDDVSIYTVKKGRRTKDEPKPPSERTLMLHLDNLGLRLAPISWLMGKKGVAFSTEVYGGDIDGVYATAENLLEVSFDAASVDLSQLPIATPEMKLSLKGVLSGEADLSLDGEDVKKSTGALKLSFDGLGLGPDSAMGGFTLPEVTFSKAAVAFEAKEGKLEVTEGDFVSDTLEATLSGDISLNKKLARSRNHLDLVFSLPDDIDKLAQMSPELKRARDEDGKYHASIGGTVLSPTFRFSRSGSSKHESGSTDAGSRPGRLRDGGGVLGGDMDPSMSDEERKKARAERIAERRKRLQERREKANEGNPIMQDEPSGGGKGDGPDGGEDFDPRQMPDDNVRGDGNGPMNMPFPPDGNMPDGPDQQPDMQPGDDMPPDFDPAEQ